jgi:hypothetical protein
MSDASLIVPGVIHVGGHERQDGALVQVGAAVGWTMPKGIQTWRRELSVVLKEDLNPALCSSLGVVLPEAQGDDQSVPRARKAAQACNLVAVEGDLVEKLVAKGTRVHTVGFDAVSNGFFYMGKGGNAPARRIQAALIEMIAPSLTDGTNQEIESFLDGLIDRFVSELTDGVLTEPQLELADALPSLGPKDRAGAAKLQELEGWLILVATRSAKHEAEARSLVETLRTATMRGTEATPIPLLGEARRIPQTEIMVEFIDGDAGQKGHLTLPSRNRWFVTGKPTASMLPSTGAAVPAATPKPGATKETPRQPAVRPVVPQAPPGADAAAAQATAQKAAADKAAADRTAAERAAAERAAAERASAERAAAERAAAERAAAERAAAERAAAERAAAERAAADRAEADRVAAERASAERAAAENAAAEKAAAEKVAAEKASAEKAAADKAASERAAAEKAKSQRAAAEKPAAERAVEKAKPVAAAKPAAKEKEGGFPIDVVVLVLVLLVVIVVVLKRYVLH